VQPAAIHGADKVEGLRLSRLGDDVAPEDMDFLLAVDQVVLAIGQATHTGFLGDAGVAIERGRIVIDRATGQTSNPKYFAGGDCTNGGREVVDAVADGKRAGLGIAGWLGVKDANA
jgi:glutamate synthase (NADPH/NADH) small chain